MYYNTHLFIYLYILFYLFIFYFNHVRRLLILECRS
jgi:hypothetical protein